MTCWASHHVKLPVNDEGPADTASDVHVAKGMCVLARPARVFGPARGVRVVGDVRGQVELRLAPFSKREILPAFDLMREEDPPCDALDRAPEADTDAPNGPSIALGARDQAGNVFLEPCEDLFRCSPSCNFAAFTLDDRTLIGAKRGLKFPPSYLKT